MSIITTDSKHYNDIAFAIREKLGTKDKYKPDAMAGAVGEVYDTGLHAMDGEAQNQTELINQITAVLENKAGTFYDAFWDAFQANGTRTEYRYCFNSSDFVHLDPKYPIEAKNAEGMLSGMRNLETVNWDKFDLTSVGSFYSFAAYNPKLKRMDTHLALSVNTPTLMNSLCRQCTGLEYIEKITAYPEAVWKQSFEGCTSLSHVIFEGTIGQSGLDVSACPLDHDSLMSIIHALKDYSGSGATYTVALGATNLAKLTDAEKQIATQKGWTLA